MFAYVCARAHWALHSPLGLQFKRVKPRVGGEPDVGSVEYPLFLEDVHYMFRCAVVLKDEVRGDVDAMSVCL